MALTTDYTGRQTDMFIFQGAIPRGEAELRLGFDDLGLVTTGIQKVAQTWLILFLTPRGSAFDAEKGTDFIHDMRTGRIRTENDVSLSFASAAELVRVQQDNEEAVASLPLDERLDDAELQSFEIDRNAATLILYVRITTLAGDGLDLFVPVPVAIV
jgi:hypothetical protein